MRSWLTVVGCLAVVVAVTAWYVGGRAHAVGGTAHSTARAGPARSGAVLASGTELVLEATWPAGAKPSAVEAFLFTGEVAPPEPAHAEAFARSLGKPGLRLAGDDALRPIRYRGVAPGKYLACEAAQDRADAPPVFWACMPVTVLDGERVREVQLALHAVP